jgi:hypothetical protein
VLALTAAGAPSGLTGVRVSVNSGGLIDYQLTLHITDNKLLVASVQGA